MSSVRLRATSLVLVTTVAAAGLSACSDDEKAPSAKDAWNKSQDTLGTYKSVEMRLDGTAEGKKSSMTMKGELDGDPSQIMYDMGGSKLEMRIVGAKEYDKANLAFLTSTSKGGKIDPKKVADKWIEGEAPKSDEVTPPAKSTIDSLRDDKGTDSQAMLSSKATVTKSQIDGHDAWKITSEDKKLTAWVSRSANHDLLKVSGFTLGSSSGEPVSITVLSHDTNYGITAPAGATTLDKLAK